MKLRMLLLVVATGVLAVSGCSGKSSSSTPVTTVPSTSSTTPAAAGAEDACGDTAATVKQKVSRPEVQSVNLTGACTLVTIVSTLSDSDTDTATTICEAAAQVAYTGDTNSVAVQGKSGKELAVGIKGAPCIGEP